MTNYEKIKAMSATEIAESIWLHRVFTDCSDCPAYKMCGGDDEYCYLSLYEWLESEVEE